MKLAEIFRPARRPFLGTPHKRTTSPYARNERPNIVFVHGMFGNKYQWLNCDQVCKGFDFDAFAIDLVNHGARKNEIVEPVTFDHYVEDVLEIAEQGPCVLIAHSLGALAALKAASLGIANILAVHAISSACPRWIFLPGPVMRRMLKTHYLRALLTGERFSLIWEQAKEFMLNETEAPERYRDAYMETESGQVLFNLTFGITLDTQAIRCPVHFYAPRGDRVGTLSMQRKFARKIKGADVTPIDRGDHYFILSGAFKAYLAEHILPKIVHELPKTA